MLFKHGEIYQRSKLHKQHGGQQVGRISTPAKKPIILLFTDESVQHYGYSDGWTADEKWFLFAGEGQYGDMEFHRGNAAVQNHAANKKDIHLFHQKGQGEVEYIGEMAFSGYRFEQGADADGKSRRIIVFELSPVNVTEKKGPRSTSRAAELAEVKVPQGHSEVY